MDEFVKQMMPTLAIHLIPITVEQVEAAKLIPLASNRL